MLQRDIPESPAKAQFAFRAVGRYQLIKRKVLVVRLFDHPLLLTQGFGAQQLAYQVGSSCG